MKADLHIHSRYSSDGEVEIVEIIDLCRKNECDLFSVTDHNSIRGSREAAELMKDEQEVHFVPGIEIDCNYRGTNLHLLGYNVKLDTTDFDELEKKIRQKHMDAVPLMISNLEALGISIDRDELMRRSGGEAPSAELFAELLMEDSGQHSNPKLLPYLPGGKRSDMPMINFYLDYFAQGKPAYVPIEYQDFQDAVSLIRNNGGIPVVAHPGLNLLGREEIVSELLDQGAEGLEVFNNYHSNSQSSFFAAETVKRGSLMTCGSDFHGKTKPQIGIAQYNSPDKYHEYLDRSMETILAFK